MQRKVAYLLSVENCVSSTENDIPTCIQINIIHINIIMVSLVRELALVVGHHVVIFKEQQILFLTIRISKVYQMLSSLDRSVRSMFVQKCLLLC